MHGYGGYGFPQGENIRRKDTTMGTEDKAANKVTDVKGKIKESAGKATNDEELEGKGKGDQAEASVKDGVENLKDAAGNVKDAFKK